MQSSEAAGARTAAGGLRCRPSVRSIRRAGSALVLSFALVTLAACSKAAQGPVVTVHAASGDAPVTVELALNHEEQARGLMYRTELAEGSGMLFVFDNEAERTFWMSNTPIPLDIIYIRGDGTIVSIASNTTPYSEKQIPSRGAARYVLEVPGGWAARHGVKSGDKLTLPDVARSRQAGD
ncbi:MAG TPA: DUF192 domain-containing protein [Candidatus Limnocylindrales bacterium]|nr:DUF192 domain-containing protein [Candidatus Limnocylindrales bacterium]